MSSDSASQPASDESPSEDAYISEVALWAIEKEWQDWSDLTSEAVAIAEDRSRWAGTCWEQDYSKSLEIGGHPRPLLDLGLRQAQFRLRAMADQTATLADVVHHAPSRLITVATLMRAIVESGLGIARIIDPDVTSEMRLCRAVLYAVDEDAYGTVREFGGTAVRASELGDAQSQADGLVTELEQMGFKATRGEDNRVVSISYNTSIARVGEVKPTKLVDAYLGHGSLIYGLFSGAPHGRMWFLRTYLGEGANDEVNLGGLISGLLRASNDLTRLLCVYWGLDPEPYTDRKQACKDRMMAGRHSVVGSPPSLQ